MARDQRCLRPRPPRASASDARTGSGRLASAARRRDERACRARAPRVVRARRRALLRRPERPRGRRLADVARRVAAPGDRYRRGRIVRRAAPPANAVFVDVGAHIGTHTIYALRTGRFARAIAFEPEPPNADLLVRNLEANGLSQAAVAVPKAAGAAPGVAVLHLHPRNTGAHAIGEPPSVDGQARLDVPVVRVDDELERLGV